MPKARSELPWVFSPDHPIEPGLPDIEIVAVELRARHSRLHAARDIAVVEAVAQVGVVCWRHAHGYAADRVIVAADGAEEGRIDEDRGVEQPGDGRNVQFLIVSGNGTRNVVEIIRRNQLADAEDKPVIQEGLPIPELIELRAIQRFGSGQAVVALDAAGLPVGILAVELEELNAKRRSFPADEFLGVEIRADDEDAVPAPFPGFRPAGNEAVGIRQPKAAEPQAGFFRKVEDATSQAGARQDCPPPRDCP